MQSAAQNKAAFIETAAWASATRNGLNYLQANLSDKTTPSRNEFLAEELQRALQSVPARPRGTYLDASAQRFPTWEFAPVSDHWAGNTDAVTENHVQTTAVQYAEEVILGANR